MSLGRDAILAAATVERESVDVPELGGTVLVQAMRGVEWDEYQAALMPNGTGKPNFSNMTARLVQLTLVDDAGTRLFEPSDVEALGNLPVAALNRITEVARRLSGVLDVETAKKNSDSTLSAS